MMINRINYIYHNTVKRGYVDEAIHWRYSSPNRPIEVERFWWFGWVEESDIGFSPFLI